MTASAPHVLITGGAGAIGSAFARAHARRHPGARLSLIDVDGEGASRVAHSLGPLAIAERWDLAEPAALPERLASLSGARGPVDMLVNCAGIMDLRSLSATDIPRAIRLLRVDLESPLLLMALVIPSMKARKRGTIVNVSSMAGVTPLRGSAFYGAAKAGLVMASEIARAELARDGVQVVTVLPGPVRSGLERRARAQVQETLLSRWLPTGDADALGARMVDACDSGKQRVIYPSFYGIAERFPGLAARITAAWSPSPIDA